MPKRYHLLLLVALLACGTSTTARGENWPGWRGPRGDGSSQEEGIPTRWNGATMENVHWKAPLPGQGHSSPIVHGNRIFLGTCLEESGDRQLLCLDRRTGKLLWRETVFRSPLETKHIQNSFASSTPVTDGETVFVAFLEVDGSTIPAPNVGRARPVTPGRMVVAAYDYDGRRRWLVKPGAFVSAHGFCSSPVLYGDLLIVNGDHDGESYIVALDKSSGETRWLLPRRHKTRSYVTPIVRTFNDRDQLIFSGSKCVISVAPLTGEPIWSVEGPTEQFVASMVADAEHVYLTAGFPTYHVMAIRPTGSGDVTETHVKWHVTNARCYVPSPVLVGKYLVVADDRGTANCFDATTGERHWQARLGSHFGASLVTAGGLVYFLATDGLAKVVRPGPEVDVVADNSLGEKCSASPAISAGQIFIRGDRHLFCIGKPAAAAQ